MPYATIPAIIEAAIKDNVAQQINYKQTHAYMYKASIWNDIFDQEPCNNITIDINESTKWLLPHMHAFINPQSTTK